MVTATSATGTAPTAGESDLGVPGVRFSRFPLPPLTAPPSGPPDVPPPAAGASAEELIAPYLDAAFYLAGFPPGARPAGDPVAHFHAVGWKEGRDPAAWFDTTHYLRANPDVRAAGIDPLLHYVRHGRAEGRAPRLPGGWRRHVIEAAVPPSRRRPGYNLPRGIPPLDRAGFEARLTEACAGMRGLVVSVSHDRYVDVTGGMQIFIADEAAMFAADRVAYLHLAPVVSRLTLAGPGDGPMPLQLTLNGRVLGILRGDDVLAAFDGAPPRRLLVVHSLFGHQPEFVAALAAALAPMRRLFWLHDYASLCSGYNLLRNDVAFCGAPPENSAACQVCVYGEDRAAYRARIATLFETVPFDVLAPSAAALALWRDTPGAPAWRSARVHPNALLRPGPARLARPGPVRVAFAGFPLPAKGWPLFQELLRLAAPSGRFAFHHFANAEIVRRQPGLAGVQVQVDRHDRMAMARAVAAADIDLAVLLAPWPETFSYVAREAMAGGADVVTLADSGAVAEAVRETGRGVVLADEEAALAFFLGGAAEAYVARQRAEGRTGADLLACGTSASFDPVFATLDPARLAVAGPDLVAVAGAEAIAPVVEGAGLRFALPEGCARIRLLSRHTVPARLDPAGGDFRQLGVAVGSLRLDGRDVPIGDARREYGWHGAMPGDAAQWTCGDAVLRVDGARSLELTLAPGPVYQRCPLFPDA